VSISASGAAFDPADNAYTGIDSEGAADDGAAGALGDSLRRLMDAAVVTAVDDEELNAVAQAIDALSERLEGVGGEFLQARMPWPSGERMRRGDRAHNPVIGSANPLSPPMPVRVLDDGSVVSEITMRPIHEGPPGYIHGGWVASLLDQLLGVANTVAHVGGMTAELTIRYRKGTPFGVPLVVQARTDSVDGRRIYASGEILADGVVTAEASGVFIRPSAERAAEMQRRLEALDET
jgi:acyl-coenzyme A thioesterase PaaI-like protein